MVFVKTGKGVCSDGFRAAGARRGKYGVALISADAPAGAVGVFTKNSVKAAPVKVTEMVVKNKVSLIVANSGSANACTETGMKDARAIQEHAAKLAGVTSSQVAVASTGIIGVRIDVAAVNELSDKAAKKLSKTGAGSLSAAKALMTTDTKPKQYSVEYKGIQVGGIAKGSGMIKPGMATMLCFITTNARLDKAGLERALVESTSKSFNMVSIDGEESTNDMTLLLSSGKKKCSPADFQTALDEVCISLAKMIAKDGEGATKLIEVKVKGAKNASDAPDCVSAILGSPLVKTAVAGENPNWGRIMAKIGSVIDVNEKRVDIYFESKRGKTKVASKGVSTGKNRKAASVLKAAEIKITVDLNQGKYSAVGWGCDLTKGYVKINAEYN